MKHTTTVLALSLVFASGGASVATQGQGTPSPDRWRTFEGTWSSTGQRQTLPTEGERPAAIVQLSGSIVLTSADGMSRGFRGEAIGFDDGRNVSAGRSVWTDERGDRVYSELKGEPIQAGRRIVGTITGGTGRYAGATGQYEFTWQYVVQAEEGVIQGRAVALKGRVRLVEGRR